MLFDLSALLQADRNQGLRKIKKPNITYEQLFKAYDEKQKLVSR